MSVQNLTQIAQKKIKTGELPKHCGALILAIVYRDIEEIERKTANVSKNENSQKAGKADCNSFFYHLFTSEYLNDRDFTFFISTSSLKSKVKVFLSFLYFGNNEDIVVDDSFNKRISLLFRSIASSEEKYFINDIIYVDRIVNLFSLFYNDCNEMIKDYFSLISKICKNPRYVHENSRGSAISQIKYDLKHKPTIGIIRLIVKRIRLVAAHSKELRFPVIDNDIIFGGYWIEGESILTAMNNSTSDDFKLECKKAYDVLESQFNERAAEVAQLIKSGRGEAAISLLKKKNLSYGDGYRYSSFIHAIRGFVYFEKDSDFLNSLINFITSSILNNPKRQDDDRSIGGYYSLVANYLDWRVIFQKINDHERKSIIENVRPASLYAEFLTNNERSSTIRLDLDI